MIAWALRERGIDADALFHRAGMPPVQLRDANRRQLAQQYLKDPTVSTAEMAYLLGFAETSRPVRAMRRWRITRA